MIAAIVLAAVTATAPPAKPALPCAGVKNPPLCHDLLDIYDRHEMARAKTTKPAEAKKIDASNLARTRAILNQFGWPGKSLVGEKASQAAWVIIQNADLATQKIFVEVMQEAVNAKELSPALFAATVDRIAVREGRPQKYGTEPNAPIEDEEHVDERRESVGLPPRHQ
jgi:hypothetical protein